MHTFLIIIAIIAIPLLIWLQVRFYKANKEAYSKPNIIKSMRTLGILALILILFVWLLVMISK